MQEFAQTPNGRKFLVDVNRIAVALERLATVGPALADSNVRLAEAIDRRTARLDALELFSKAATATDPTEGTQS